MTDKIQQLIDNIRLTCSGLHENLVVEQKKNASQITEIEELKKENKMLLENNELLIVKIEELSLKLRTAENNVNVIQGKDVPKEDQIDDLVRGIEYCINQLKK
jgi:hypothetical protein